MLSNNTNVVLVAHFTMKLVKLKFVVQTQRLFTFVKNANVNMKQSRMLMNAALMKSE